MKMDLTGTEERGRKERPLRRSGEMDKVENFGREIPGRQQGNRFTNHESWFAPRQAGQDDVWGARKWVHGNAGRSLAQENEQSDYALKAGREG